MPMNQEQWWAELKALQQIKRRFIQHYLDQVGCQVLDGPFRGLLLPKVGYWNSGDHISKVYGFYERCLHPILYAALSEPYAAYLDVGCADGYYVTGFARACPQSLCIGFDVDERAQESARRQAVVNGLDRCQIRGLFGPESLDMVRHQLGALPGAKIFLKCDIEGAELSLFDPGLCAILSGVDLLIEIHDFGDDSSIADQLRLRLASTHHVSLIGEHGRNPNVYPFLRHLPEDLRWLILSEGRWTAMNWLWARARM